MKNAQSHHKVQEILQKTNGQVKTAEAAIRTLIERDHTFLLGLVEPYLSGIIGHAIERARKLPPARMPLDFGDKAEPLPKKIIKPRTKKMPENDALGNVLDAMAQKFSASQGQKKPEKASAQHVTSLQALATKQFGKKKH
jgi:hypothetical protein